MSFKATLKEPLDISSPYPAAGPVKVVGFVKTGSPFPPKLVSMFGIEAHNLVAREDYLIVYRPNKSYLLVPMHSISSILEVSPSHYEDYIRLIKSDSSFEEERSIFKKIFKFLKIF